MSFRAVNQRWLIPVAQTLMVLGIIALCQPWVEVLHRYGVTIILIGLVGFMVTTKIPAPPADQGEGDA
jgi:type IV secretory pathway VirB2 component (pilin)